MIVKRNRKRQQHGSKAAPHRRNPLRPVAPTDAFNAAFPKNRIASVEVTLKDGQVFQSEPTEALGDPENPISEAGIHDKFEAFTSPVIGGDNMQSLLQSITELPTAASAQSLAQVLAQPHSS